MVVENKSTGDIVAFGHVAETKQNFRTLQINQLCKLYVYSKEFEQ